MRSSKADAVEAFDIRDVDGPLLAALTELSNVMRAEASPDLPPRQPDELRAEYEALPPFIDGIGYVIWSADRNHLLASAVGAIYQGIETNQHLMQVSIDVRSGARRRGLATRLLAALAADARRLGRSLLISNTLSTVPSGDAFVQAVGAQLGMSVVTNQLLTAEVDRELMQRWVDRHTERAADYDLIFWEGAYPADRLDDVAALRSVMNTAPTDDLDVEDVEFTAEQVRQMDASLFARGFGRWTLVAQHRPTGELAGYTEIFWRRTTPHIGNQNDTAVAPAHRGKGLGRWLKAAMILKVLDERPAVEKIRTGNANSNAPMLKINHEMGFKPYKSANVWQVPVETAAAYCAARLT